MSTKIDKIIMMLSLTFVFSLFMFGFIKAAGNLFMPLTFMMLLIIWGMGYGIFRIIRNLGMRRYLAAISLLQMLNYPENKIKGPAREIIKSYVGTVPILAKERMSLWQIIETSKPDPAKMDKYLTHMQNLSVEEKNILLDHATRMIRASRSSSELPQRWFRLINETAKRPELVAIAKDNERKQNSRLQKEDPVGAFREAMSEIAKSDLPEEYRDLAERMIVKLKKIRSVEFKQDIDQKILGLITIDIPALTNEWLKVTNLTSGKNKMIADEAFKKGLLRLAIRFEELLEEQASHLADNVTTKSNYLKNAHTIGRDDPFHEDHHDININDVLRS